VLPLAVALCSLRTNSGSSLKVDQRQGPGPRTVGKVGRYVGPNRSGFTITLSMVALRRFVSLRRAAAVLGRRSGTGAGSPWFAAGTGSSQTTVAARLDLPPKAAEGIAQRNQAMTMRSVGRPPYALIKTAERQPVKTSHLSTGRLMITEAVATIQCLSPLRAAYLGLCFGSEQEPPPRPSGVGGQQRFRWRPHGHSQWWDHPGMIATTIETVLRLIRSLAAFGDCFVGVCLGACRAFATARSTPIASAVTTA